MPAPLIITTDSDLLRATKGVGSQLQNQSLQYLLKYPPEFMLSHQCEVFCCYALLYLFMWLELSSFEIPFFFLHEKKTLAVFIYDAENIFPLLLQNAFNAL